MLPNFEEWRRAKGGGCKKGYTDAVHHRIIARDQVRRSPGLNEHESVPALQIQRYQCSLTHPLFFGAVQPRHACSL